MSERVKVNIWLVKNLQNEIKWKNYFLFQLIFQVLQYLKKNDIFFQMNILRKGK